MDTFAASIRDENSRKFNEYHEMIPNFEATCAPINNALNNIDDLLRKIREAGNVLEEICCDSDHPLLGAVIVEQKIEKVVENVPVKPEETFLEPETPKVNEKKNLAFVPQITEDEFKTIPKYQLGRFTLEVLNEIVAKMDEFLTKKNKILAKANKSLTRQDRELIDNWRELEEKTRGRVPTNLFFVSSDILPLLQDRLRPLFAKSIPCLRHIHRVREARSGPLTFYFK